MASSISIDGARQFRPGVYAKIDASALGGEGISTGNVAVVGLFPAFEMGVPAKFTNPRSLADHDPSDLDLSLLGKLAFSPSTDSRIAGGAASLTVMNVQPSAQASHVMAASGGGASVDVKSKLWGPNGNRTFFEVKTTAVANVIDVNVSRDGIAESFKGIGLGGLGVLKYSGAELATSVVSASSSQFQIAWTRQVLSGAIGQANTGVEIAQGHMKTVDVLGFDPSEDPGMAISIVIAGQGTAGDGSSVTTETVTLPNGAADKVNSANKWSSITSLTITPAGANTPANIVISGVAFDLDAASAGSVANVLTLVGQAAGFTTEIKHPKANVVPASELDAMSNVSIQGANETLRARTWSLVEALKGSALVSASRSAGGSLPPAQFSAASGTTTADFLAGGSASAVNNDRWSAALEKLASKDIQTVVVMSTDVEIHKAAVSHCKMSALLGRERNAWAGTAANMTLASIFETYTSKLNSPYLAVVGQEVKVVRADGRHVTKGAEWLALILACMQAGSSAGTPLTMKRPDVVDLYGLWDSVLDANDAIQKGLVNLSLDDMGWRVERSVTTYMTDDNPVYSEVSAFESAQTSVRDLRASLASKVGEAIRQGGVSPNQIRGVTEARLRDQVSRGILKAWQNMQVEDLGDRFRIRYEMAAVEPLNFIEIVATVTRIAA